MFTKEQKEKFMEKFATQVGKLNGMAALEIAMELFVTREEFLELKEKVDGSKKKNEAKDQD